MAAFKDAIGRQSTTRLANALAAGALAAGQPAFPAEQFVRAAVRGLGPLELKARVAHVAAAMAKHLPDDFEAAAVVVERGVVERGVVDEPAAGAVPRLEGFEAWPVLTWVELAGRSHPEIAVPLLGRLTSIASAEFAIRPFIDDDPAGMFEVLQRWTRSDDEHVRRLVSEGSRPLLPWAPRLVVAAKDPGWAVPLLDVLVDDESEYVRRSVANHLNDLCKLDVALTLETATRWKATGADAIVRHGLRTLVKKGDPAALRLIGIDPDVAVVVEGLEVSPAVARIGDVVEVRARISARSGSSDPGAAPVEVMVDYGVHMLRANGTLGRKVFKLRKYRVTDDGLDLVWRHSFKPVTVRRYYPGLHRIDLQVNGRVLAEVEFELTE